MLLLLLGLVLFFAPHVLTTLRPQRAALVARLGARGYRGLYSAVAGIGLVLIVLGWGQAAFVPLWTPPGWTRHLAMALMLPALILIVTAHLPGRIAARMKHPMLAGIKLWATAHLLANGDLAGLLLFGAFLAYGVYDRISVKRRTDGSGGVLLPNRGLRNDVISVVAGIVVYAVIVAWAHGAIIGRPLI